MNVTLDLSGFDLEGAVTGKALIFFKRYSIELYRRVIQKTPVDTGRLRGNWQVSPRSPKTDKIGRTSKTLEMPDISIINSLKTDRLSGIPTIFITNNLVYADVVERGLYPNPPKKGNKVQGGFSKKAPQGMARLSIQELMDFQ